MVRTSDSGSSTAMDMERDVEGQKTARKRARHWELVFDQVHVTPEVLDYPYKGSGTERDPYVVEFIPDDRRNPMNFTMWKKWTITILLAFATLAVSFVSSAYTGGVDEILEMFNVGTEVVTLGVSLFVLGFAIGPLLWAPLSELYGRQVLFIGTYAMLTAFNAGAAGAQNIQTLLIMRFFAGAFGSSPLTNAGGVIADMFSASHRGVAMSVFAAAPFLGPAIGPIVGGFLGETEGWRWVEGLMAIFYWSTLDNWWPHYPGDVFPSHPSSTSQQDVLHDRLYMAIIYGTLYMMFGAFPIVYQVERGWSAGIGGLAFCGVAVGMMFAVLYSLWDNKRYNATAARHNNAAPPEARLPTAIIGSICLPVGLFWFAWTNSPSVHWIVSIIATAPFGFGMVLVFLSIMNYLIDSYVLYAASVLAANSVLRSLFGAAFPLFTTYMYKSLGIHWASSIPAFLALACVPFPYLFYKYGEPVRMKCKFAAEAARVLAEMRGSSTNEDEAEQRVEDMEEREARRLNLQGESESDDAMRDGEKTKGKLEG
ncbi:hypothetical protein EYC84_008058 [Monilinia fructicola]|uniref:Major facilitator superfamily (MFS) profile domain-containing protein n=1 Tax=Monilinia fructicola TaxID=38448 RepID=A0A5M9JGX9_MONFR|nr:hypothetical protein EYC84_008058 [Monilinia fructicola]